MRVALTIATLLCVSCNPESDALTWPGDAVLSTGPADISAPNAYVTVPLEWPEVMGRNIVGYRVMVDDKRVGHTSKPGFIVRLHSPARARLSVVAEGLYGQSVPLRATFVPPKTWPRGTELVRRVRVPFGVVNTEQVREILRAKEAHLSRCMPAESAHFQARIEFELKSSRKSTGRTVSSVTVLPRAKREDPTLRCLANTLRGALVAESHAKLVVELDVGNPL